MASELFKNSDSGKTDTQGSCLMQLLGLGKSHISQIFGLCVFLAIHFITAIFWLMHFLSYLLHYCHFFPIVSQKIAVMK